MNVNLEPRVSEICASESLVMQGTGGLFHFFLFYISLRLHSLFYQQPLRVSYICR